MSRAYRAPNRRVIQRAGSGQFRQTTLADVGVAQCRACGEYFTPDVADLAAPINPRDYRDRQERCAECREKAKFPSEPGYYWLRVQPLGTWQPVHLTATRVCWFFGELTREQCLAEHDEMEWGPRLVEPNGGQP